MLQNRPLLQESKNLLAFSAGVDSSALLFLLLEHNIKFDIAIVNYGVREQSKKEVAYAQELAKKYHFQCFILDAKKIKSNFEANARKIRYDFFEQLIKEHSYKNLLTAHHLGDRFEWMLMQFCKGAGCVELSGMKSIEKRSDYTLLRPLLHLDKEELLEYLHTNNFHYFEDASNSDFKYKRNEFRHLYAKPLLQKYLHGIKKSFEYIDEDIEILEPKNSLKHSNQLYYFQTNNSKRADLIMIDRYFKSLNILCSSHEKKLLKNEKSVLISRRFIVVQEHKYIFIAPYIKAKEMPKILKEQLRLLKIDPKLRGYLASDAESVVLLSRLLA